MRRAGDHHHQQHHHMARDVGHEALQPTSSDVKSITPRHEALEIEDGNGSLKNGHSAETESLLHDDGSESFKRSPPISSLFYNPALYIDNLPRSTKFMLLVAGLFSFFGIHNYLQEMIMRFDGFTYGWYLGFLEVLGVTVFSYWERKWGGETGRRASLKSYAATTLCLMGSSSLSNIALNYINYPTKVVFRSCKLIPTMIIAGLINKRTFGAIEYAAAFAVCLGLILFAFADINVSPSFSPWGILLVSISVVCDAILPNLQEKLFAAGSSRLEVTYYSNVMTLLTMIISMLLSGDLIGATSYALHNHQAAFYLTIYTLLAYLAISLHMTMVKQFGSVVAVLVGNSRKSMTIVLSFILFPKPYSSFYGLGGVLVLGGLTVSAYMKNKGGSSNGGKSDIIR